jgi:hypothetical protein
MPLKVIGPPWMIVMVPVAKRVLSAIEVATTVTIAGVEVLAVLVGMVAGAV